MSPCETLPDGAPLGVNEIPEGTQPERTGNADGTPWERHRNAVTGA